MNKLVCIRTGQTTNLQNFVQSYGIFGNTCLDLISRHGWQTRYKMMSEGHAAKTNYRVKDCMMLAVKIRCGIMDIHRIVRSFGKFNTWGYRWHKRYAQAGGSDGKMYNDD